MRYLRKETAFITYNGKIIIPECFLRLGSFSGIVGQTVYVTAKSGSILISCGVDHNNSVHIYDYSTVHAGEMMSSLEVGNILSIPQEVLSRSNMTYTRIVALYLLDLNTIEVFPRWQEAGGGNQGNRVNTPPPYIKHCSKTADKLFVVENKNEILKINLSEIYYFEKIKGTHNTCIVFSSGVSTFKSDLHDVLEQLDGGFVQCHKAFIANMSNVKRIQKQQGILMLHFDNGHSCPCSVFYKKAVLDWKC